MSAQGTNNFSKQGKDKAAKDSALIMADEELYKHYQQCSSCKTSFEKCDPRILPCLHSVCLACLEKISQEETCMCPCCSEHLEWTATLADNLPTDHHRRSILEYMNIKNDRLWDLLCKKCGESKASFKCKECIELLCQNCLKEHCRFIKNHTVISFNDVKKKEFHELIFPLICENHKFPLEKYCCSDQKAICYICELTYHRIDEGHMVENISTVYTDKKQELELNIAACKENLEAVTDRKVNIANEIEHLNETRSTLAGEIDASINNLIEVLENRRKDLKDDLNSAIESCRGKWIIELKALTDVENKQKEALGFAEKSLDFLGQEDFCQAENIISDRLQKLDSNGRNTYFKSSELMHIRFARGDVGMLNQLIMTNNWLSLVEFKLNVADEIRQLTREDKEVVIGQLKVCVANEQNFSSDICPLQIVVREKYGKEIGCKTVFDETERCFKIKSQFLTTGDYSLEVLLKNKCVHQQTFKFIAEIKGQRTLIDKTPYGTKQRLDEQGSSIFVEQEMQCPACHCPFSFNEETSIPRVLPCLHTIDTKCITAGTNSGTYQCPVCKTKHVVKEGDWTCFAVDETRRNLTVYGNLRLEDSSYLHCKAHKSDRATFMCKKCCDFLCEQCSRNHSSDQHSPVVRVPQLEALKETPISKLYTFYPCDQPGHEQRMLELFCLTCEKPICHECNFDTHRDHKVDKIKVVYDVRYAEIKTVLKQAEITKDKADSVASEIRNELEVLRKSQDQELVTIRKVFNNCKTIMEARKKSLENEVADIASKKRDKMQSQLTKMEDVARAITISNDRALDLIEFSSEVSFLSLYETLKRRLKCASESCRQTYLCENGFIKYFDDSLSNKIINVTKEPGRLWPCHVCLHKTKHWITPAVAKQEDVVLKLQFLDYEEKTTPCKNLRDFLKINIMDSDKQSCTNALGELVYGDEMLSVSATFDKAGSYKIVVCVFERPVSKDGYDITVRPEKVEQEPKEDNEEKAVDIVLGKLPIVMGDHTLQIEVYNPIPQEPEPECTIEVRGPQEILKSDMLEMYFESEKLSSGGKIAEVTREENVIFVTFNSEEVAQRVVKRGQHKINAQMIQVTLHHPRHQESPWQCPVSQKDAEEHADDSLWTVKVDSVSQIESMETLQMYFENKRRSGGGAVAQFEVYKEEDRAYITYEEEEVARRVVEKGPHKIEGKTVEVSLCEPLKSRTQREPKKENEQEEPLCSIKVKGISNMKSLETLEYYFENAKRSGGGSIEKFEPHEEEDFAYVTFGAEDVARRVGNRKHKLEEVDLSVSLYKPPRQRPAYGNRVIIEGVNFSTTKDRLFNFLALGSGASPTQLVYGEQEGTVMVTFETEPDFQTLVDVCRKRTLEKSTLTVSEVCMSNCIIISNLKPSTSSDTVQFYFENKRRSNGGDIEKVKMLEEIGTCLVFFQDYTVVDDVLLQKHRLEGQELSVQVYIEKLGRSQRDGSEPRLKIPDAITINDIEEKIVDFMKKSDSCIEAVHKQLDGCYAKVVWPEKGSSVVVECEITVNTPDYRKLVKDWKANVEKNMKDYVKMLCLKEHPVWDEGWEAVLEGLGEISIEIPDGVALFVDKKEKIIKVVGYSHTVVSVSKTIEEVIEKIKNDIEKKNQTVKQTLSNLKPLHLRMLLASKFKVKTKERLANLKVIINHNKNELTFEGVLADIQSAKVDMYEKINSFAIRVKENISQNCIDLYQSQPVRDFIARKLKSGRLVGVWEATGLKLAVCSAETDLPSCFEFITDAVQEKMLSVNKVSASIFTSQKWQERLKEIYNTSGRLCKVSMKEDFSKIYITATSDIIDELTETVASFLAQHTIFYETLTLGNKSIVKLIQNHHTNKLADIAKDLTHHYVQMHCDSTGISVQGTENGIRFAKEQLTRLAHQLQKKEHSLYRPVLSSYMDSEKVQDSIKSVENAFPVVIKLGRDEEDIDFRAVVSGASSQAPDLGLKLHAIGEAYDDRIIYSAEGEMSQISVDVLVNSADNSLSLSGGLGKVLANRGGSEIIEECQDYVKKYGKLNEGDVFMSSGGDLPARFIAHVSSPQWRNGQRKETEVLKEAVSKAMLQATIRNANSIAIPALGCGNYGFPLKTATEIIVTAVKDFFRKVQESEIMKVYLVDVKPMTVEAFTDAMKDAFAKVHPVSKDVGHQNSDDEDEGYRQKPVPQPRHKPVSSDDVKVPSKKSDGSLSIGGITITVKQGDITESKTDCIVNSSNDDLDLSRGAVAQALLRKGGEKLRKEAAVQASKMKTHQMAMTSAPGLPCQHIIHVVAQDTEADWKKVIGDCLQLADSTKIHNIAFPALGTGLQMKPKDSAKIVLTAIHSFASQSPRHLKEIIFIIYQEKMMKDFKQAVKNFNMDKPASVWSSLKGAFGGKSAPKKEHFRYEPEDPNVVTITLYSLSMRSINDAITRLEKIIDQDLLDKVMKDSIIEKLTPDQVRELRAMAKGQQIQLEVQQNKGHLKMAGISKNVMDFTDKAQKFLRGIERFELEKNHAEMLKNIVQWFYIEITEVGQNLVMYTPLLNFSIEKAFKDQQPSHQFKDSEGVEYTVDFAAMEEYPVDNKEDTVKVIRRDLIKDSSVETPTTWTPMNKTENLKVVTLQPSDSEYNTVVNLFNTTCQGSYTITKVDRIQNLTLYQQYQAKKKLLDQQNKSGTQNERTLWHGTAPEAVDSINAHGFNRSYCGKNATAFGDGVYFAVSAGYSCQNTYSRPDPNGIKRMYLCKVLTGEFVMGKHGMRVPPQKPSGASAHALYDSVVNNVQNPSMFIIFNDTQAYPDYLVAFK